MRTRIGMVTVALFLGLTLVLAVNQVGAHQSGINTEITISPTAPTTNDVVSVTASGIWNNACVPEYLSHQRIGNIIRIDAVANPPGVFCALVLTGWQFTVDLGSLPADTYLVELYIKVYSNPPAIEATKVFTVQPATYGPMLINAIYYDTYLSGEPDEAFELINVSTTPVDLTGWTVTDFEGTVSLTGTLGGREQIWIAREADDFHLEFGFKPDYEYQSDTDPEVPDLTRSGSLTLANDGDQLALFDNTNTQVDAVLYEMGGTAGIIWVGEGIAPYDQGFFGLEGQILYRKQDPATGLPVGDTDTALDWAQAVDDDVKGKKVQYPGWDTERYFFTHQVTQTASITYAIAPDALYDVVADYLARASQSIYYEGYTFKNAHLADIISATLSAHPGMTVTMVLEGAPVGGIEDQQKRNCQIVEAAGGQCWFMINDSEAAPPVHDRYTFQHAKFMVIDGQYLLTGSENLNYSSMPADDKADGTAGNRGCG